MNIAYVDSRPLLDGLQTPSQNLKLLLKSAQNHTDNDKLLETPTTHNILIQKYHQMERETLWHRILGLNIFISNISVILFLITLWEQIQYLNMRNEIGIVAFTLFFSIQFLGYMFGKNVSEKMTVKSTKIISYCFALLGAILILFALFMKETVHDKQQSTTDPQTKTDQQNTTSPIQPQQSPSDQTIQSTNSTQLLLITGIILFSVSYGSSRGAEQYFLHSCLDKNFAQSQAKTLNAYQYIGQIVGCLIGYMIVDTKVQARQSLFNFNTSVGLVMVICALLNILITLFFFQEVPVDSKKIYYEILTSQQQNQHHQEQELERLVEDHTLSGYQEWRSLKNAEADQGALIITLLILLIVSFVYGSVIITQTGLLFLNDNVINNLILEGKTMMIVIFSMGALAMFIGQISQQILQKHLKMSVVVLFGLTLMNSSLISFAECLGMALGALWTTLILIKVESFFLMISGVFMVVLIGIILTLVKLEIINSPHWSIQISKQEQIIKTFLMQENSQATTKITKNYYESLDSGEQARDIPIYVGKDYNQNHHHSTQQYKNHQAINNLDNTFNSSNQYQSNNNTTRFIRKQNTGNENTLGSNTQIIGGAGLLNSDRNDYEF
eukprot:403334188